MPPPRSILACGPPTPSSCRSSTSRRATRSCGPSPPNRRSPPWRRRGLTRWASPLDRRSRTPAAQTPQSPTSSSRRTYFSVLDIAVVRGRVFTAAERSPTAAVALVSESVARALWPTAEAVGQAVRLDPTPARRDATRRSAPARITHVHRRRGRPRRRRIPHRPIEYGGRLFAGACRRRPARR